MKTITYIYTLLFTVLFISCTSDNSDEPEDLNKEIEGLVKIQEISNDTHMIEIYAEDGAFNQGYNDLTLRIVDKVSKELVTNATLEWTPVMHMTDKMHSCPKTTIQKSEGKKTLYNGQVVFQMATMGSQGWVLTIAYSINGTNYEVQDDIEVLMSEKRVVSVFTGEDGVKYVLALIEPRNPEVKINDMTACLFKMENMMSFPAVKNYTIELDPRMPSMGNHSSPNNEDLVFNVQDDVYQGKLSLTMTGLWNLNMRLMNENDELIKGELITEEHEKSSLFFEIEF